MVTLEPNSVCEQMQHDYFTADHMITVYYTQRLYDAVLVEDPIFN